MHSFGDQCLDMARSILSHNLGAINEDGTLAPIEGEASRLDEPGHAALAIGEFFRVSQEPEFRGIDLVDLSARCITAQTFTEEPAENGLAHSALGLLAFSPAKDRNLVWERLVDLTRRRLDHRLLARTDYQNHLQAFNIAKAVARYSMGLSKKDETGKLIDRFIERIQSTSSAGFCDDCPEGLGGVYDVYGVLSFVFIRQALQLHANIRLLERKLPTLRTYAEKYIKIIPDLVRQDGLGWAYGRGIGAYGQMHCISLILQAMRDNWIAEEKQPLYFDVVRRLFQYFFTTFLDQEHGYLVIRDEERNTGENHTTRMANFDAVRYLCQWSRLARSIGNAPTLEPTSKSNKASGRFIVFTKTHNKEQGLFLYRDPVSGLHIQLPLVGPGKEHTSDSIGFPHCPGIFDWPVDQYQPIMVPELTFGDKAIIPCYYGKRCVTGIGLKNGFYFRYEQPELVTKEGVFMSGLGNCKANWTFCGNKVSCDFQFMVFNQTQLDSIRYVLAISMPHSRYKSFLVYTLGEENLRVSVTQNDFQMNWLQPLEVGRDPIQRSYYGRIRYYQTLARHHPFMMQARCPYRIGITFEPDIHLVEG